MTACGENKLGSNRLPSLVIRRLVRAVRPGPVEAFAQVEWLGQPYVDPTDVDICRHDGARDDREAAVGSSREFPCVIHVETRSLCGGQGGGKALTGLCLDRTARLRPDDDVLAR